MLAPIDLYSGGLFHHGHEGRLGDEHYQDMVKAAPSQSRQPLVIPEGVGKAPDMTADGTLFC